MRTLAATLAEQEPGTEFGINSLKLTPQLTGKAQ